MTARHLQLNDHYLSLLRSSNRGNRPEQGQEQEQFNNCLEFRVSLYTLSERLFTFIKERFENLKRQQNNSRTIKETVKAHVRTSNVVGSFLQDNANKRITRIEALSESEFTDDWRTFARCYTGNFLERNESEIDKADPKGLLEILKYCSLFREDLGIAANDVIKHRNKHYAHLSVLLIDSDTFYAINSATTKLIKLIEHWCI